MSGTDTSNFNTLYTSYFKKSLLFTKSYVHDDLVAEDIVSESLIKLWELLKSETIDHPNQLLVAILKNKSLDYLKHQSIRQATIESLTDLGKRELDIRISTLQACDPEVLFSDDIKQIITRTLASLPEQTRHVFELSRFENKTNKEIAEQLGITLKGVEYHITKALKPLRTNLKDYLPLLYLLFFFNKY